MSPQEYNNKLKLMIDELKAMSTSLGLSNTGDEYKIISELFTYKFLNDKLVHDFENRKNKEETFEEFVDFADDETPKMKKQHLIYKLYQKQNDEKFHKIFDKAFEEINELNKDIYTIETTSGKKKPLFEKLSTYIRDEDKELQLAKRAINILQKYDLDNIYDGGFDYFSSIFEYLIEDYNKDSGKYAEYFTPLFAGNIMSEILYNDEEDVSNVKVYDPAAGSGTLLLSMANKIGINKCQVYSQDISQKSTQFLRINLILNNLVHSLHNVIEGNTLTTPEHLDGDNLMKFDYIVSNPPFKMDYSNMISTLESDKFDRFFAGLPNIPNKKKSGMAIYTSFLQHIIASLSKKGKAAVVIPTGFTTISYNMETKIRKFLVEKNWLTGVLHMPPNIFATTNTSVSILFIDKTKNNDKLFFMDASNFGTKTKFDDGQRTILSDEEKNIIMNYFKNRIEKKEFSVLVDKDDVASNNYYLQAGQYVELKPVEYNFDIDERLEELEDKLYKSLKENEELSNKIIETFFEKK
ncbi:MAG: HsdM family class I SAM-dependent methyltransferase [bacterium]